MEIFALLKRKRSYLYIGGLLFIVIALSTKGITDESVVSLNGDMPKFLMNGVYLYDLLTDLPVSNPMEHAYLYFAQYPALSLGHHPILLGITEVPFYAIFGISVFSARLCIVFFAVLGAIALFFLVRLIYGDDIAFLASALYATTPFVVKFTRIVMPEIQAMSLIIVAAYFFIKYFQSDKTIFVAATILFFVLSLYAKHLSVFILPVFILSYLIEKGPEKLFQKEIIVYGIVGIVLTLPLVFITLKFSQSNVQWVAHSSLQSKFSLANIGFYPTALYKYHVSVPVLVFSLIAIAMSVVRRDGKIVLFVLWILGMYLLLFGMGVQKVIRHGMYWIPAICVCAAASTSLIRNRPIKMIAASLLTATVVYQFVISYRMAPEYASGYEKLAKYVVKNWKGDSILYSSPEDSGYLIFFIRKYDHDRKMIILRADKILASSKMDKIVDDKVKNRDQIYQILNKFGVYYVVLDDKTLDSQALEIFNNEVKTSSKFKFVEGTHIGSESARFNNTPLDIYEYVEYKPAKTGKILKMDIPLAGDSIRVPFNKLFDKK